MSKEQKPDLEKEIWEKIELVRQCESRCIVCNKKCDNLICNECKRAIKWARLQMYRIKKVIVEE